MSNREFDNLTSRFLFFSHDSNDSQTEVTKKYNFKYSHIGFLLLDGHGKEVGRVEELRSFQFDETVVSRIGKIEKQFLLDQSSLVEYLESMLGTSKPDSDELKQLVNQLASEKFTDRNNAEEQLTRMGSAARAFLNDATPSQPEARIRTRRILDKFAPLEKIVERHGLSRNIPFLAMHASRFPNIKLQLKTILPDVDLDSVEDWWQDHAETMEWDPDSGRYVLVRPST